MVRELRLPVRLVPPELAVLSTQNYVTQGGAGVVVYRVGETSVEDGVQAGEWFFPGAPLPGGGPADRFCLFGVPWDLGDGAEVRLVAEDDVAQPRRARLRGSLLPEAPGPRHASASPTRSWPGWCRRSCAGPRSSPTAATSSRTTSRSTGELRRRNAAELVELAPRLGPGLPLEPSPSCRFPNAKVMSAFADQRTYVYEGREVDQQTHLGYDLASVAQSPVPAANRGVVLLARYFGIYGNTVVLDHGYGLMTLYAHLSTIDVEEGQTVERGASLGRTGATGLAGGDHLHFTTLVRGLPVNPTRVVGRELDPRPGRAKARPGPAVPGGVGQLAALLLRRAVASADGCRLSAAAAALRRGTATPVCGARRRVTAAPSILSLARAIIRRRQASLHRALRRLARRKPEWTGASAVSSPGGRGGPS